MNRFTRKVFATSATVAAVIGLSVLVPGAASAAPVLVATAAPAPAPVITSKTIFDKTIGKTQYVLKELTIPPGASTGWHYHPGPVLGLVKQGTLTHYESDCSVDGIYHKGQSISEESGPGYVHMGRNLGRTPVVLEVLYQNPVGSELAVPQPAPGCSFQ